jgi:hypothetical protein
VARALKARSIEEVFVLGGKFRLKILKSILGARPIINV